jgi:hypothetical protein
VSRALAWIVASVATVGMTVAQAQTTVQERARTLGHEARGAYGTQDAFTTNATEPLTTDVQMRALDGQAFDARLQCDATQQFLRVSMEPQGSSDIAAFTVELDADVNGTAETTRRFVGPFAGVCNNGVVQCDAGTWNNCRYFRWAMSGTVPVLEEVRTQDLGACYCVNASCGANLLFVNANKVVSDLGVGALTTISRALPRITAGSTQSDETSITFFGHESGCGVDHAPEQYFDRPNDMAAAGVIEQARPGSVSNFLLNTSVARQHGLQSVSCDIRRDLQTQLFAKSDILRFESATRGGVTDCGTGCLRVRVGDAIPNLYGGGAGGTRCRLQYESATMVVGLPDRIQSATLQYAAFDDALRLNAGGAIRYTSDAWWTFPGLPAGRCDYGNRTASPNADVLDAFRAVGSVNLEMELAHDRRGDGYLDVEFRVREGCDVVREDVIDGCVGAASNASCQLKNEWVDGVQTVRDYRTTGLGPTASSRSVGAACQVDSGPRAWWQTRREYECRTEPLAFDVADDRRRADAIHASVNPDTGEFTDLRRTAPNTWTSEPSRIPVPAADSTTGCTPMCRTRKPKPGVAVGDLGPQSALNTTGVPYDFTFRECEEGACPLQPGEELVSACDCRSNFAQAASMMQTIRTVGEDMICTAP